MTWEDTFKSWGSPPSATEQQKMENAETAIRKAIKADPTLATMDISIIPQGSYRSRTNVRLDSDVDISVRLNSTFFTEYPTGKNDAHYGNTSGSITHREYKDLIHKALDNHFGSANITPGNKAFDVHSNTYRVDADVVPAFAHRHYYGDSDTHYVQPEGIGFLHAGTSNRITNWPHQTYTNGKDKHDRTNKRFRKIVRIIKRLRNKMQEEKIAAAKDIASFLIESMVWNAPDDNFGHDTYTSDVRHVLAFCFNQTLPAGSHATLVEVNDIKYLFHISQPWTREQAHSFFSSAWDYIGFK